MQGGVKMARNICWMFNPLRPKTILAKFGFWERTCASMLFSVKWKSNYRFEPSKYLKHLIGHSLSKFGMQKTNLACPILSVFASIRLTKICYLSRSLLTCKIFIIYLFFVYIKPMVDVILFLILDLKTFFLNFLNYIQSKNQFHKVVDQFLYGFTM
jgi:hypothetical protein